MRFEAQPSCSTDFHREHGNKADHQHHRGKRHRSEAVSHGHIRMRTAHCRVENACDDSTQQSHGKRHQREKDSNDHHAKCDLYRNPKFGFLSFHLILHRGHNWPMLQAIVAPKISHRQHEKYDEHYAADGQPQHAQHVLRIDHG